MRRSPITPQHMLPRSMNAIPRTSFSRRHPATPPTLCGPVPPPLRQWPSISPPSPSRRTISGDIDGAAPPGFLPTTRPRGFAPRGPVGSARGCRSSPSRRRCARAVPPPCGCPRPLLTEYASEEYGQGIRCLFHLPSAYSGRGGKCGKEPLGILAGCQVKGPARKVGGKSPCPDKIPLQTRCGTTPQAESYTERHRPRLRERSPVILIEIGLHGNTSSVSLGPSKDHAIRHGPPPSPPALSKNGILRPGLDACPSPLRLINW